MTTLKQAPQDFLAPVKKERRGGPLGKHVHTVSFPTMGLGMPHTDVHPTRYGKNDKSDASWPFTGMMGEKL